MPITPRDRQALVELIETYGDSALRAVGLAHRDMPTTEISARTENLTPEDLEHDLVLDAIVVRGEGGRLMDCVFLSRQKCDELILVN